MMKPTPEYWEALEADLRLRLEATEASNYLSVARAEEAEAECQDLRDRVENLQKQVVGEHVVTLEHWSRHMVGMDYGCFHCERRRAEKAGAERDRYRAKLEEMISDHCSTGKVCRCCDNVAQEARLALESKDE